jgi:hypothetical protein
MMHDGKTIYLGKKRKLSYLLGTWLNKKFFKRNIEKEQHLGFQRSPTLEY